MMFFIEIPETEIDIAYRMLRSEVEGGGYRLNPDLDFTKNLIRGLLKNERRYGYRACPCRLAAGKKDQDLDIICPCDYRDPDLDEFGACYCALYVSDDVATGRKKIAGPVPERRPPRAERSAERAVKTIPAAPGAGSLPVWVAGPVPEQRSPRAERSAAQAVKTIPVTPGGSRLPLPVWRCRVCGYLCAREQPPGICPICKATRERFERFI